LNDTLDARFHPEWERFVDQITRAFEAPDDPTEPAATQEQWRLSVANNAVARLLESIGKREIASQFYVVAAAFHDLAEGIPHPLMKPSKLSGKPGRNPDTAAIWMARCAACIGIEYMVRGGSEDEKAIIKHIVSKYGRSLSKLLRPGADLGKSLRGWLKKFRNLGVENDIALDVYKHQLRRLADIEAEETKRQIRDRGERFIKNLIDQLDSEIFF
jgi:hypothetical protein